MNRNAQGLNADQLSLSSQLIAALKRGNASARRQREAADHIHSLRTHSASLFNGFRAAQENYSRCQQRLDEHMVEVGALRAEIRSLMAQLDEANSIRPQFERMRRLLLQEGRLGEVAVPSPAALAEQDVVSSSRPDLVSPLIPDSSSEESDDDEPRFGVLEPVNLLPDADGDNDSEEGESNQQAEEILQIRRSPIYFAVTPPHNPWHMESETESVANEDDSDDDDGRLIIDEERDENVADGSVEGSPESPQVPAPENPVEPEEVDNTAEPAPIDESQDNTNNREQMAIAALSAGNFKCPFCQLDFKKNFNLKRHMIEQHEIDKSLLNVRQRGVYSYSLWSKFTKNVLYSDN